MRRISLAIALLGAVAAAGCGGGSTPNQGAAPGVAEGTFTITIQNGQNGNSALAITGGYVTSTPAGIDCGIAPHGACSATFPAGTQVALTASPVGTGMLFLGWAGDCAGWQADGAAADGCTLTGKADRYIVASFGTQRRFHPNFSDPAVHGEAVASNALTCSECHGANLQGVGLAVPCSSCHDPSDRIVETVLARQANLSGSSGLQVAVTGASIDQTARTISVSFAVKDAQNAPVDLRGVYSRNRSMDGTLRIALARIDVDPAGRTLPYAVLTPATGSPGTITLPNVGAVAGTAGQLVETGTAAGTYTWTSPALPKIDVARLGNTHTIWIQATRQTNLTNAFDPKGFSVVNLEYNFDTATGAAVAAKREIVTRAACNKCHAGFKAEPNATNTGWASFHSGARVAGPFCNVCHNPGRTSNPAADSLVFVHRIHGAHQLGLPPTLEFHGIAVTYPQDVRNCDECHGGAAQGAQAQTRPSRAACGSCHFAVDFAAGTGHTVQADDSACAGCHSAASIASRHVPVLPADPNNSFDTAGGNIRTNAGAIAAVGALPAGADRLTAEVGTVSAVPDAGGVLRPTLTFKLKRNGTDVVFNTPPGTPSASAELMNGFVGTTTAYFAWAVPQDGIAAPADFNVTASGNLKMLWMNTDSGTGAGDLTGPDASGFYTVTLTGARVAANAVMLTGGIGYSYDLPNAQPFTQVNLTAYPAVTRNLTTATAWGVTCSATAPCAVQSGGLIVPVQNVWKTATGFNARRSIVATDRCNACHGFLGVGPSFHVGQRNDGATCSFCHNPNRTSSAWSANASTFIHGIHGAKNRTVPFNWHAGSCPTGTTFTATPADLVNPNAGQCLDNVSGAVVEPSPWYPEIEYPGSACTQCHVEGGYDFSANAAAVPNLLWTTAGTGTYAASISTSPYVTLGQAYGAGFSYNVGTGATTAAAATTLVSSPIAAACFSCHDNANAKSHMEALGGKLYVPRSSVGGATLENGELCLSCHGPGKIAAIAEMHR